MRSNYKKIKSFFSLNCSTMILLLVLPFLASGALPQEAFAQAADAVAIDEKDAAVNSPGGRDNKDKKEIKDSKAYRRAMREKIAGENAALSQAPGDSDKIAAPNSDLPGRRRRLGGAEVGRGLGGRGQERETSGRMGGVAGIGGGLGAGLGRPTLDLSQLNLSDEQKSRITALRSKTKGKGKEIMLSIKAKRGEMREMIFDPAFNASQIRAKASELRNLVSDLEANKLDDLLAIRSILNPDQVRKLRPGAKAVADVSASAGAGSATAALKENGVTAGNALEHANQKP